MSTIANPLYTQLIPGGSGNPTGTNVGATSAGEITNPYYATAVPGSTSTTNANPYSTAGITDDYSASTPTEIASDYGSSSATTGYVPTGATQSLIDSGITPTALSGGYTGNPSDLVEGLVSTGMPRQTAALISEFLTSGAGYNSGVANALIAQMQPSIMQSQENLAEQQSAYGNRFGSPAAYGEAQLGAQTNEDIGSLLSQLYEQSVSNYMNVLMGVSGMQNQTPTNWDITGDVLGMTGL